MTVDGSSNQNDEPQVKTQEQQVPADVVEDCSDKTQVVSNLEGEQIPPTGLAVEPVAGTSSVKDSESDSESNNHANKRPVVPENVREDSGDTQDSVDESDDAHRDNKRPRSEGSQEEVLDLAETFGLKAGDRVEVKWDVYDDEGEDENEPPKVTTRWWGAVLQEHDGRTVDSVAIRVLDYDPYPEGGFPERSKEDVVFIGHGIVADPVSHQEFAFRKEGSEEVPEDDEDDDDTEIVVSRENIEPLVNGILQSALEKVGSRWSSLPAAQQAAVAEVIAKKKAKLVEMLQDHVGPLSHATMQSMLNQVMS